MNKTVQEIVRAEFHVAKRTLADQQQSLEFAVEHRAKLEGQLATARRHENEMALSCQKASDRLDEIKEFLWQAGVLA